MPQVSVSLDGDGGSRMGQTTRRSIGVPMGVLFIEQKSV
jgi:preprotein translocase subunit SecD